MKSAGVVRRNKKNHIQCGCGYSGRTTLISGVKKAKTRAIKLICNETSPLNYH
jgi:hypothetical protein